MPGSPWEYVFYVDVRFDTAEKAEAALGELRGHCRMVKVLGPVSGGLGEAGSLF